jgi:acetoin utilization protein AcuB
MGEVLGMQVRRLMTHGPKTVGPTDSLEVAGRLMAQGKFRCVPVVDQGRVIGIVTNRDVLAHADALKTTSVGDVMTGEVRTVTPETTAEEAARILVSRKFGGLPVIENGRLAGIITTSDLLSAFVRVEEATQSILDD